MGNEETGMYLRFYKLRQFPFSNTCQERCFYESAAHAEALANMTYTVQHRKGMVLITGEVGSGKTFVGNMLCSRLDASCLSVVMRNPPQSAKQLVRALVRGIGMNLRGAADKLYLVEELEQHLIRLHNRGRRVVLIVDEAQGLSAGALEEIRLLWNCEQNGDRLIQIVLIGQPELRVKLQQAEWEPLRQRIALSYHLGHMSMEDTAAYISHRLKVSADSGCLAQFTSAAVNDIYAATDGLPRPINTLCDSTLLVGYAKGVHRIDSPIVAEVVREMTCWGVRTLDCPAQANAAPIAC